jgi:hypothetical protein
MTRIRSIASMNGPTGPVGISKRISAAKQMSMAIRSPGRNPRASPSLTRKATAIDRMQRSYGST